MTIEFADLAGRLGEVMSAVAAGGEVIVTDNGRPAARIGPPPPATNPSTARVFDMHPGAFDPPADFDAPLPDEFWLGDDA